MSGKAWRGVVLLALLSVAGLWWLWRPAPAAVSVVAAASAAEPAAATVPAQVAFAAPPRASELARRPPAQATALVVADLCGLGRMPLVQPVAGSTSDEDLPRPLGADAVDAARAKLIAALQTQGPRQQGAALLLKEWLFFDTGKRAAAGAALGRLARDSGDPVLVSWALNLCTYNSPAQACGGLTARDWIRLEPGNAAAWGLLLASEPVAASEALQGLARADQYRQNFGVLAGMVQAQMLPGVPAYVQSTLVMQALSVEAAGLLNPQIQALLSVCRPPGAEASERQRACDGIARALVEGSDTLLMFSLGTRIAEPAGWSPKRVLALRAELVALQDTLRDESTPYDTGQPYSCQATEALRERVTATARDGELATLRALRASRAASR